MAKWFWMIFLSLRASFRDPPRKTSPISSTVAHVLFPPTSDLLVVSATFATTAALSGRSSDLDELRSNKPTSVENALLSRKQRRARRLRRRLTPTTTLISMLATKGQWLELYQLPRKQRCLRSWFVRPTCYSAALLALKLYNIFYLSFFFLNKRKIK